MSGEEFMKENRYCLFLQMIPGIGKVTLRNMLDNIGSPSKVYNAEESVLRDFLNAAQKEKFLRMRETERPEETEAKIIRSGIRYFSYFHPEYPKRLMGIEDKPIGLFVKGRLPDENKLTVSVIGTRSNSQYGKKMTEEYARILSDYKVDVISGMARGIDGIAQKSVIKYKGRTYAVLGSGVDVCYPPEHIDLYSQLPDNGGIISEYRPGTQPVAGLFPPRNRIISGLSDVVMVMEARLKSGTMITVDMALEQGKEIFALPGRMTDPLSAGCNALIGQGAGILPPPDVFEEMIADMTGVKTDYIKGRNFAVEEMNPTNQWVWDRLKDGPKSVTELWKAWEMTENKDPFPETEILMILAEFGIKNRAKMNILGKWELI